MRLENRRIFRVLMETHFPWSVFNGKTGFGLLSARRDQRRRRHGAMVEKIQFQKILKNIRLFVKNHSCIATFRPLLGSQQLPLVPQTTPLAPQVPPGSTPIDGGGILLFLDFRHFRPLAPHTRPPRTLYVRSTTDPTPKASPSPCLLYTSPSPRDGTSSRMPSSA